MKTISVGWFEIPVSNMDRAILFYNAIFQIKIGKQTFDGTEMGWFPFDGNGKGAAGSLIKNNKHYKPSSSDGILVYFSCSNVNDELSRIEKAGGKTVQLKTQISENHGYMATFLDSEGNRIALHSLK